MDEKKEHEDYTEYKEYVHARLEALTPIFAKAAVGDFSSNIKIPDTDDDFTRFYVGIQVMLDVIHTQIETLTAFNGELENKVKERTEKLKQTNTELTQMNALMIDREVRMADLKKEYQTLESRVKELEALLLKKEDSTPRDV